MERRLGGGEGMMQQETRSPGRSGSIMGGGYASEQQGDQSRFRLRKRLWWPHGGGSEGGRPALQEARAMVVERRGREG